MDSCIEQLVKGKGDQDVEFWNYLQEDNPGEESTNHMTQQIQDLGISDWEEGSVVSADIVKEFIGKYIKEKYASYLPALHAIAHGMCLRIQDTSVDLDPKSAWETFCSAKDVHITIQGQLDRQLISQSFQFKHGLVPNDIIIKKVEWLKKWIKEEASEDEVKLFLKYVTGAPVLGVSHLIIDKGGDTPLPVAHTCFNRLDISDKYHTHGDNRDDTPEYFIASLKNAMLQAFGGEGSYSAG